ncbi:CpaF family protein [Heyndrickxia oleronia]|uniref:CpaF family protein n=1 Tax=Heyndrickxia oleronia TaxID=38875 RepID=UPI001B177249|nr:ATPase, T2SS/T4P/T4SS family [Heyndrickxia oleronia]GIN41426.1 hypothetical protein J19TS1_43750 [Heyndrickxia oleronia]
MPQSNMINFEDYIIKTSDENKEMEKGGQSESILSLPEDQQDEIQKNEESEGEIIPLVTSKKDKLSIDISKYSYQYRTEKEIRYTEKKKVSLEILNQVREFLSNDHKKLFQESIINKKKRQNLSVIISDFISQKGITVPGYTADELIKSIIDSLAGLDVLEDLIDNEKITDINVNGRGEVWVDELGVGYYLTERRFSNDETLYSVAMKIVNASGESLTSSKPYVDCRYPTMRINIASDLICGQGISISIRKFATSVRINDNSMIKSQQASDDMIKAFEAFVKAKFNVLIVGPTGSGKTELLKYLVKHVDNRERLIMLEDTAETRLKDIYPHKHIVSMECRFTSDEDTTIDLTVLLKNALRQNPTRIAVGECRGPEAVNMIEIFNTGHEGGFTTAHSNSAPDAVKRLVMMCLRSGMKLDPDVIGKWVTSTFDVVIFQKKMEDHTRRIGEVVELIDYENNTPVFTRLFNLNVNQFERENGEVKKIHCSHEQQGFLSLEKAKKIFEAGVDPSLYSFLVSDADKEALGIENF